MHDTFTCTIHEGISNVHEEYHDSQDLDVNDQSKNLIQECCSDKNVTADKEMILSQDSAVKGQLKNLVQGPDCSNQSVDFQNIKGQSINIDVEEQFDSEKKYNFERFIL